MSDEVGSGVDGVTAGDVVGVSSEVAALRARLVQAELRTAAVAAGMVDLDGVKLIDLADVRVDEAGAVVEAGAVMAAMKAAKPWLFGKGGSSSSSSAAAPRAEAPRAKTAMQMSVEEWREARAALLRQR